MLLLKFKAAQGGFFDRQKVIKATDKAERKVLSKFGAFVRTRARSSMRRAPKKGQRSARPGKPPYRHVGLLHKFLFFSYSQRGGKKSVVIGPAKINKPGGVPELLEHGGRVGRSTYQGNPFMQPALDRELPGLPEMWRNSVK